jgi:hypothetical protein
MENIEKRRNLSFWYIQENNIQTYKTECINYLEKLSKEIKGQGLTKLIINFYDLKKESRDNINGHVYIHDLEDNEKQFEKACKYLLSKERKFMPTEVKCKNKKDYKMIKEILEENYGKEASLKNNFWIVGKTIKINHQKP